MIRYTKLNKIIKLASVVGIVLAAAILLTLAGCSRKVNVSGVKIGGVALEELRIYMELTGDTDLRRAEKAEELSTHVNTLLTQAGGTALELADGGPDSSPALIFTETAAKGYDDYTVRLGSAGQVLFEGGSNWALKMAFSAFLEAY
ncbi:MAG: hypothetical protein J6X34_11340, partial [Clostridia bacterium]|nr:hypothetical protein [Clostridia bacterium]